jgi:hypothetical protein
MYDELKTVWKEALMASFTVGVLFVHSHGGAKENNGKLCSVPRARFDLGITRVQEYKSTSLTLLAWTLISRSAKFAHQCISFEDSASENFCVVWNSCCVVICALSSISVRGLESTRKDFTELSLYKRTNL